MPKAGERDMSWKTMSSITYSVSEFKKKNETRKPMYIISHYHQTDLVGMVVAASSDSAAARVVLGQLEAH